MLARRDQELTGGTAPLGTQVTSLVPVTMALAAAHAIETAASSTGLPSQPPLPQWYSQTTAPETSFTAAPPAPLSSSNVYSNNLDLTHQNTRPFLLPKPSYSDSLPAAPPRHQPGALPPRISQHRSGISAFACFIQALRTQGIHDNPEFIERGSAVYDQVFRYSFSPTCPCKFGNNN